MSPSPLADFLKEYWEELLIGLVIVALAGGLAYQTMENKVLTATLKNAKDSIKNYEDAARANLQTIEELTEANNYWATTAEKATAIATEQAALVEDKTEEFTRKEASLKQALEKAHAANKEYSDAVVPDAVARRLRENSRSD